jgi:hypothetical protein
MPRSVEFDLDEVAVGVAIVANNGPYGAHRKRAVAGRQGQEKLNDIKLFKAHLRVH